MIEVHRATAADAPWVATGLEGIYSRSMGNATRLATVLENPDFVLLVAQRESRTIGYLHGQLLDRLDGDRMMLIYDLEVHESEQRKGAATALLERCLELAAEQGAGRSWLVTDPDNEPARALYETRGGTEWAAMGFQFGGEPR